MLPAIPGPMLATQIATWVAAVDARVIARLREAGATEPGAAVPLEQLGESETGRLRALLKDGVVVEATPGRYYLSDEGLRRREQEGKRVAIVVLGVGLVLVALVALLVLLF